VPRTARKKHGTYSTDGCKIVQIACWRAFCDFEIKVKTKYTKVDTKNPEIQQLQKVGNICP